MIVAEADIERLSGAKNPFVDLSWLYSLVFREGFPVFLWANMAEVALSEFESQFTLHDSNWVGLYANVIYDSSVTLIFDWDTVWLPERLKNDPRVTQADRTFLLAMLPRVQEVSLLNYENERVPRSVLHTEAIRDGDTWLWGIRDIYGGEVQVQFDGWAKFLAVTSNRDLVKLWD